MSEAPRPSSPTSPPSANGGSGLAPNVAGALSYLLGAATGVLFLIVDRGQPFVRFHALQSIAITVVGIAVWIAFSALGLLLSPAPLLGGLVGILLGVVLSLLFLFLWLYLMYRAFQGDAWEIPWLGEQVRRHMIPGTPGER